VKKLLAVLFASVTLLAVPGCVKSQINVKVQQALIFEDQVHAQVNTLRAVFDAAVPVLPVDKQQEYRDKIASAYGILEKALDAKDQSLQAALAASADTVDVSAAIVAIVNAVQDIIAIVAAVGASPLFIEQQHQKARALAVAR
jgi:hypothetical protein